MDEDGSTVIDLFCGAGGFSEGFRVAGFEILLGVDNDLDCIRSFVASFPHAKFICKDIRHVNLRQILAEIGNVGVKVILGGPPCQGFSLANKQRFVDDPRNVLYREFVRLVHEVQPVWFVMENVTGLLSMGNIAGQIIGDFEEIGYRVKAKVLCAADYGVPQVRHRCFFLGNNAGLPIVFPEPTHAEKPQSTLLGQELKPWVTVAEALGHGGIGEPCLIGKGQAPKWKGRVKPPPAIVKKLMSNDLQVLSPSKPSSTILASTGGWNLDGPYVLDNLEMRVLTWQECGVLQGFPKGYRFFGSKSSKHGQIGNAVPPLLAKAIAMKIRETL